MYYTFIKAIPLLACVAMNALVTYYLFMMSLKLSIKFIYSINILVIASKVRFTLRPKAINLGTSLTGAHPGFSQGKTRKKSYIMASTVPQSSHKTKSFKN